MTRITYWSFDRHPPSGTPRESVASILGDDDDEMSARWKNTRENKTETWLASRDNEATPLLGETHTIRADQYEKELALITKLDRDTARALPFDYTQADIEENARAKCAWLFVRDIRPAEMSATNRLLKRHILLVLLCQDKHSGKLTEILDRFHEIYLKGGNDGLANYRHVEYIDHLVERTHRVAQDPENDAFYEKCTAQKKRGRTSDAERLQTPDPINLLRKDYTTPKKPPSSASALARASLFHNLGVSTSVVSEEEEEEEAVEEDSDSPSSSSSRKESGGGVILTDKYVVFRALLALMQETIPTQANYGWYIGNMRRLIRLADEDERINWPMLELCKAILNMEALIELRLIEDVDTQGEEYYCSYSGDRILDGDQVYLIRLLEYDAVRHRKWRINKAKPTGRPFEETQFTHDVSVYMMKRHCCSPSGLFPVDFDPAYRAKYAAYFGAQSGQPIATTIGTSKVWHYVDRMRRLLYEQCLAEAPRQDARPSFAAEFQRLSLEFDAVGTPDASESFRARMQRVLGAYCGQEEARDDFVRMMFCHLVDFVSLFFAWSTEREREREEECPAPRTSFTMEEIRTLPRNEVHRCELLRQLLVAALRRQRLDTQPNPFLEAEKTRGGDLTQIEPFVAHSFLFLAVFHYLFPLRANPRAPIQSMLQLLGLAQSGL